MLISKLVNNPVNRFFAFGCSFTNYDWTTWPEIVAEELNVSEFYNLGKNGAGNELIFNRIMQADQLYDFKETDLIIVCWTNVTREDRYLNGKWESHGNIYNQKFWSKEIVESFYSSPTDLLLHDFAFIKAARILLQHKKVNWHFLQMLDVFQSLTQYPSRPLRTVVQPYTELHDGEQIYLKPSFYDILWQNNLMIKRKKMEQRGFLCSDLHPTPAEHFQYLRDVFDHEWNEHTMSKVQQMEEKFSEIFVNIKSYDDTVKSDFGHLRLSDQHNIY